ncbi:NAD(P)/FAD-dependent oxidoreductase [Pseudozobellia sp. WGM2]|uniref:NAD(P)/FAD-dependent oxidoreductase n=1 Tax=Pseudozobellia sp. WGM2 TaxID=2787625 RepID=UPI001ADF123E
MKYDYDVVIIGGGLAGLTAALHLAKNKYNVLVIEKNQYPNHKVCGEYVSNEVVPYLDSLGIALPSAGAASINHLLLSTTDGNHLKAELPLGGQGISRYTLDDILYNEALSNEVDFLFEDAAQVLFKYSFFEVVTGFSKSITSRIVIGAYGKRSTLDKKLNRRFIATKSSWMAVKSHYEYSDFPKSQVALHNFQGGYGGLSKTESGAVNFCYLASYESFKKEKNIESFNSHVVAQNPFLKEFLANAKPLFEQPLTIAQISFEPKSIVENHLLMCGDSAGLIHPLCGNGMAMAIHSAKIAAECIHDFFTNGSENRQVLERRYLKQWQKAFKKRLWYGRQLQRLLLLPKLSSYALSLIIKYPAIINKIIKATHGQPL